MATRPFAANENHNGLPDAASVNRKSDRKLIQSLRDGNKEAMTFLDQRYRTTMTSVAEAKLKIRDDAEDVVQDIFERMSKVPGSFIARSDSSQREFIIISLQNKVKEVRRPKKYRLFVEKYTPIEEFEYSLANNSNPFVSLMRREVNQAIQKAISKLGARQREIFLLRHEDELSVKEVALKCGISQKTVRATESRVRYRFEELLGISIKRCCEADFHTGNVLQVSKSNIARFIS